MLCIIAIFSVRPIWYLFPWTTMNRTRNFHLAVTKSYNAHINLQLLIKVLSCQHSRKLELEQAQWTRGNGQEDMVKRKWRAWQGRNKFHFWCNVIRITKQKRHKLFKQKSKSDFNAKEAGWSLQLYKYPSNFHSHLWKSISESTEILKYCFNKNYGSRNRHPHKEIQNQKKTT